MKLILTRQRYSIKLKYHNPAILHDQGHNANKMGEESITTHDITGALDLLKAHV